MTFQDPAKPPPRQYDPTLAPPVLNSYPGAGGQYPPQPSYGYDPQYTMPTFTSGYPMENGAGVAALVLGIISLVTCPGLGIAALICGRVGMKRADLGLANNRSQALAGVICGCISTSVYALFALYLAVVAFIAFINPSAFN